MKAPTVDQALGLAARGIWVFPLRAGTKFPAHKGWQNEATTDPDAIRKLWGDRPHNIGIYTAKFGDGHGLLVVDVDKKGAKDGYCTLLEHDLAGREFPPTLEHSTPSGGRHLIYSVPVAVRQGVEVLGPGLDIRSHGGYVVAPGSVLDSGRYYVDRPADIAPAPQWLIDACGAARANAAPARSRLAGIDPTRAEARAIAWLKQEPPAAAGERNDAGYRVAAKLKDLGVELGQCAPLMLEHWTCEPMLDADELLHVVRSAFAYGREPQGADAPEAVFDAVPVNTPPSPHYRLAPFSELLAQPPPAWLVRGLLPRRGLAVVYGQPGSGKSFLMLDLAAAIARGVNWGGLRVKPGVVVYVALEGVMGLRARAYASHHGLHELPHLYVIEGQGLNLLHESRTDTKRLIADLRARGPVAAVVVDTLNQSMPGGNENASEDMGRAIGCAGMITAALDCLCVFVHHSGKNTSAGARGHSSLLGAADAELEVTQEVGTPMRYVRATKVKDGENGARFGFRLESVDLGAAREHDPDAETWERDSSCVVVDLAAAAKQTGAKPRAWTPHRQNVMDALRKALADSPPAAFDATAACTVDQWRAAYHEATPLGEGLDRNEMKKARNTRQHNFTNTVEWLKAEKLVRVVGKKELPEYSIAER